MTIQLYPKLLLEILSISRKLSLLFNMYITNTASLLFYSKHPTPMTIQLHPQCLLGMQSILRNWTFLIFKQV